MSHRGSYWTRHPKFLLMARILAALIVWVVIALAVNLIFWS
jgi:hypothetical protein